MAENSPPIADASRRNTPQVLIGWGFPPAQVRALSVHLTQAAGASGFGERKRILFADGLRFPPAISLATSDVYDRPPSCSGCVELGLESLAMRLFLTSAKLGNRRTVRNDSTGDKPGSRRKRHHDVENPQVSACPEPRLVCHPRVDGVLPITIRCAGLSNAQRHERNGDLQRYAVAGSR